PRGIAGSRLKGGAVVVKLIGGFPAGAVALLALCSVLDVRQPELSLGQADQMRGKDDAAGVAGPVADVDSGVIFRQKGVAGIAENALNKVQIADQVAGGKEAHLIALFANGATD